MAQSNNELDVVGGEVLDGERFPHLYQLLDLERSSIDEWQRLSLPAAAEVLAAFESEEWRNDKQAERDSYISEHGFQPQWSATSERSFFKWLQDRAERDGHPVLRRTEIQQLKSAAECIRILQSNGVAAVAAMVPTERAWRPAAKLLSHGFRNQIPAMVERAVEIAEEQGSPRIESGHMLKARTEIWNSDPEIRQWVEQPNQTVDPRSAHDKVVTALIKIRKEANDLRKQLGNNPKAWSEFLAGLAEIQ